MDEVASRAVYHYSSLTAEQQAVRAVRVISTGQLSAIGGAAVAELEQRVAANVGRTHAVATASATAGLEVALRTLGAGPGRDVVVPELCWVSVGAAAAATGAAVRVAPITRDLAPTWEQIEP